MMNVSLRHQLLRALVRDGKFLKAVHTDINPLDFPEAEERIIAASALDFYEKYEKSIGGTFLAAQTDELAKAQKFNPERKKKLENLRELILGPKMELISVQALEDRVKKLKEHTFYENAIEEIIQAYEEKKLDSTVLADLVDRAHHELKNGKIVSTEYLAELEKRIERRKNVNEDAMYPRLMIDPLDRQIHAIGRGQIAMFLAPPASGKGLALVHLDIAYASQGYNVLHITLEDPKSLVEDRLDANIAKLTLNKLGKMPIKLRTKFELKRKLLHGRIRIIDGTEEGWTVTQIEKAWEQERQKGFVADVIVVDYDDELICEKTFKGESGRRFEFAEIYRRMRRLAAKLNVIFWTAAQTGKQAEKKRVITGKDVAEDYSKIRKVFMAIGIGSDPKETGAIYLHVLRHRHDKSKFTVKIMSDFSRGIFYDVEATNEMNETDTAIRRAGRR